jgi:hypothetical protein
MLRRGIVLALALAGPFAVPTRLPRATAQEPESAKLEASPDVRFIRGLRDRGYFDLALEYTQKLLADPATPEPLKPVLTYEVGRGLLEEATRSADLEKRYTLLEQARTRIDEFTEQYPRHELTPEALVQLARLYVERGHTAMLQAQDAEAEQRQAEEAKDAAKAKDAAAQREQKLVAARAAFGLARKAYEEAEGPIKRQYDSYPAFIPEGNPLREVKKRVHVALMEDQLQHAIVDYEEAQTFPQASKERADLLDKALKSFEDLYNKYRTMPAGLYARMLQGKSYEEKGELGAAMGIYDELMEHGDAELRDLQRQVGYFRIIVDGKRGDKALAVDDATRWLQANPNHRVTENGLGVQLELARNLIALLPEMTEAEAAENRRKAAARLGEVVRYYSPHKQEALKLLAEVSPKDSRRANQIATLTFDDAMAQADTAISTEDWALARDLLNQAIRRAGQAGEVEKVNRARYFLAFADYSDGRYYEAYLVADHLARRYPEGGLSAKSTEIGMAALTMAYNTYQSVDRLSDLDRLVALAEYAATTWPESEQGDMARNTLGEIAMGRGDYAKAAEWYESVRPDSSRRLDAQVKAGDAHWRLGQRLREQGKAAEADAEAKVALERIEGAMTAREAANVPLNDPGRITNANALAEIHRAGGHADRAVGLLEPIAASFSGGTPPESLVPLYATTLSILVRAHLAVGQPDKAIADMKILETVSPSREALTQLYYELGRSLKDEMEALERKGDLNGYNRTKDAYRQFLQAMVANAAGQSYDSLEWAGESMLDLKMPAEAEAVLKRVLELRKDSAFMARADASTRLLRAELKMAAAHREQGHFDQAMALVESLIKENPKLLEPRVEKGLTLEAKARAEGDSREAWVASLNYWKALALQLRNMRTKPPEYYDAWLHVAQAMYSLKNRAEAIATLKGVMTLTPTVGSPEMKAKYDAMLKKMQR